MLEGTVAQVNTVCCRLSAVDSIYNNNSYLVSGAETRHHD